MVAWIRPLIGAFTLLVAPWAMAEAPSVSAFQQKLKESADRLLASPDVSYVYGGYAVGSPRVCRDCTQCLSEKKPSPKQRFQDCPVCQQCGIDCSHFTQRVFDDAGFSYPYLSTATMLSLSPAALKRRYQLVAIDGEASRALVGDLLVYQGHVVLLERVRGEGRGDIIHATSGRDLKGPGMGIQRERNVPLAMFRGPLLRILRHSAYYKAAKAASSLRRVGP